MVRPKERSLLSNTFASLRAKELVSILAHHLSTAVRHMSGRHAVCNVHQREQARLLASKTGMQAVF